MKIYERIKRNNFAKSVMLLTSGTAIAQVINIILSPVITRIYNPNSYGVLTVFTAILGMISLLGSLSYESAIPIVEEDDKAINILSLSFIILILNTLLMTIVILIFGDTLLIILDAQTVIRYKYFIPLGFFATGLYTIVMHWAYRRKDYTSITKTKYSQVIFSNIIKIVFGIVSSSPLGLIIGRVIGQSAGITTLSKSIRKKDYQLFSQVNKKTIIWGLKRYSNFMKYSTPSTLIVSLSSRVPVIFITSLYGLESAGLYGLAMNISFIPMTFIGKSIQDVFFVESSKNARQNPIDIKRLSNKLLVNLAVLGIVPIIIIVFGGTYLFPLVFGSEWYEAGIHARLIAIYVYTHFLFQPFISIYTIYEEQRLLFVLNILKIICVVIVFLLAKLLYLTVYKTVFIFSCVMAFFELFSYILSRFIIEKNIRMLK